MFRQWSIWEIFIVGGIFATLFGLGLVFPLRRQKHSFLQRLITNVILTASVFIVGSLIIKPLGLYLSEWTTKKPFGLLQIIELPFWLQFAMGFLLMDLTFYYWHRLNHTVPLLWRFHNIHHIDPDMDVTTSFRFHFVEILYSTLFRIIQIGLLGIAPLTYIIYELFFQLATIFHHSNVRLPIGLERLLNKVIVTPRMHGIHHSQVKVEMNANYSVVFRFWDIINRSLHLNVPQDQVDIGVAAYSHTADNKLWFLLTLPFHSQKNYWQRPDGSPCLREPIATDRKVMLE